MRAGHFLFSCPVCKHAVRLEAPVVHHSPSTTYTELAHAAEQAGGWLATGIDGRWMCRACGGYRVRGSEIKATHRPEIRCGGRCLNARTGGCDCSCNGANHGAGWN